MSKEFSGFMSKEASGGDPSIKKVQGKAATLARRRFQASFKKFHKQSPSPFSQSVSPVGDNADVFDPRAIAIMPNRADSSVRPARANSSEDFVSPKPKKSKKQPPKGQKKMSDFFSKASPPSPQETSDPESPNNCEDESDLDVFTDQLTMANIGASLPTFIPVTIPVTIVYIFADDILAVPESNLDKIEAFLKELEEKEKERELEDSIEEKDEEEFNKKRRAKEAFEAENKAYKERLETELTEPVVRGLMTKIMPQLTDLWNGKVDDSSRYSAWKKGGLAKRALLYHMITHPFSDDQLKWVLDEIFVS